MDSETPHPRDERSDMASQFDEATATLQSGLLVCQRMVADYRVKLSGEEGDPDSLDIST